MAASTGTQTLPLDARRDKSLTGRIVALSRDGEHRFTKPNVPRIELVAGLGVEGDAHLGVTVQHLSRIRDDPAKPNLRQVHLIHSELFDELRELGFQIGPGEIGENITTRGLNLLALPRGARLYVGLSAVIEVTGLRNPCRQIEAFRPGILAVLATRDAEGNVMLKSGIMGIVLRGGAIRLDDAIVAELPPEPHEKLKKV